MNIGRTFRTVRHLTPEQWAFRGVCRGRWTFARRVPGIFRAHIERTASQLPLPNDVLSSSVRGAAKHVLQLQLAVHGATLAGITRGEFHFLGRTIDFGSIDKIDWRRDLGEHNNPLWRMNLSYFGWSVPLLESAKSETIKLVASVLAGMEQQNPWSADGVFRDVWHPYSVSHRLINLLTGLALHRENGGPRSAENEDRILQHVRLCAAFLLHNLERDLQFNHLLKNFVALAVYRATLDAPCRKLAFLDRGIEKSLRQQLLGDGGHAERSPMYHALFLLDMMILQACGSALDTPIADAQHALGVMSHSDGDISLFNDSWLGEAPPSHTLCASASDGMTDLPVTGYVRLASGEDTIIFDRGPCGPDSNPGHAHADFLSIEACVAKQRFIVDPGVPTYSAGPLRDLCRSASQHNAPHIADAEPIEFWHSFRVGRRGNAYRIDDPGLQELAPLSASAWHDGYGRNGVSVGRWIGFWPEQGMLIIDVWNKAVASAGLRFLIPADWRLEGTSFVQAKKVGLDVILGNTPSFERAHWWPKFGEPKDAHGVFIRPVTSAYGAVVATVWRWGDMQTLTADQAHGIARKLSMHYQPS